PPVPPAHTPRRKKPGQSARCQAASLPIRFRSPDLRAARCHPRDSTANCRRNNLVCIQDIASSLIPIITCPDSPKISDQNSIHRRCTAGECECLVVSRPTEIVNFFALKLRQFFGRTTFQGKAKDVS